MSTGTKTAISKAVDAKVMARIVEEGYGPGAWHGADLQAALADVSAELAFWRPARERHNIAEIALHHAYHANAVGAKLAGKKPEEFVLKGEDWFELNEQGKLSWTKIQSVVAEAQKRLGKAAAENGTKESAALSGAERFELVLGITCHAIYHAGQIQLIKRLRAG